MGYETELTEVVGPSGKSFRVYEDSSGNIQLRLGGTYTTNGYSVPFTLLQCGVPIGIAPTGTMGANGAVTLGTALNTTYSGGLWLYYAAGAVFSGSAAGFYWTVMSSTTAGTVYTDTYVPGTSSFDIPASPTAVVDAGPGAFTGVTSEITAISVTVPGGVMGINGTLSSEYAWSCNNSAGNKTCSSKLAGTTFSTFSGTTATFARYLGRLQNKGVQNRNFYNQYQTYGVTNSSNWSSIDTSAAQTFTQTITRATATDTAVMEMFVLQVLPS